MIYVLEKGGKLESIKYRKKENINIWFEKKKNAATYKIPELEFTNS